LPLHQVELPGLDAANLLAYMAALGAMRTLSEMDDGSGTRLSWTPGSGCWMPVIHHPTIDGGDLLAQTLSSELSNQENRAWDIGKDLRISPGEFQRAARSAVRDANLGLPGAKRACDFLAAFGSDGCVKRNNDELIADTEFRTMTGAGNQPFLGYMLKLQALTTESDIEKTLLKTWLYDDSKPSMRWDPNDYRPHALRAEDPSGDPIKTMRGANRLAIEALPLFPTMPALRGLQTSGFSKRRRSTAVLCPVWTCAADFQTIRSLLASEELEQCSRSVLKLRGVEQLYRVERFTEGQFRNFGHSVALL
jgi:hypothetical protein